MNLRSATLGLLLLHTLAYGQTATKPQLFEGEQFPSDARLGDYFLYSERASLYRWESKDWKRLDLPDGVIDAYLCGDILVAELPLRTSIILPDLVRNYPAKVTVACWDSLAEFIIEDRFVLVDNRPGLAADARQLTPEVPIKLYSTFLLNGWQAWCAPSFNAGMAGIASKDYRNWGVIDAQSRWVIPPQYDRSFRFVEGQAKVIYYGERQVINERGERVR